MLHHKVVSGNSQTISGHHNSLNVSKAQMGIMTTESIGGGLSSLSFDVQGAKQPLEIYKEIRVQPELARISGVDAYAMARASRMLAHGTSRAISLCSTTPMMEGRGGDGLSHVRLNRQVLRVAIEGRMTCKCAYGCVYCARRIAKQRRAEVQAAMTAAEAAGYQAYMVTLTMHHKQTDALAGLLVKQAEMWRAIANGGNGGARGVAKRNGVDMKFLCSVQECTVGDKTGWHPHRHCVFLVKKGQDTSQVKQVMESAIWQAWSNAAKKVGASVAREALDVRQVEAGTGSDYVTKWGIANELTGEAYKKAKAAGRATPFQVLAVVAGGEALMPKVQAEARWIEYLSAMKGRKIFTHSAPMYRELGVEEAMKDDEAAEDQEGGAVELATMDAETTQKAVLSGFDRVLERNLTAMAKEKLPEEDIKTVAQMMIESFMGDKTIDLVALRAGEQLNKYAATARSMQAKTWYSKRKAECAWVERVLDEQFHRWGGESMTQERCEKLNERYDYLIARKEETYIEHLNKLAAKAAEREQAKTLKEYHLGKGKDFVNTDWQGDY